MQVRYKKEEYVYHYTKATNLKFMLKKDNEASGKLRLNNIILMNDPQEGILLKELFSKMNKDLKLENIFNKSDKNFIYLASFSKKTKGNELPIWVHYGDSGKGIGFKFGSKFFYNKEIYMVQYLDETFNINESKKDIIENLKSIEKFDELNELIDRLEREERLKIALKEIFDIISNTNFINNKNKNFNNIVSILLNYVSFLFKDTAYEYEKEVRVIKLQNYKNIKIDESQDIPKLYIAFNEITKETCEGIIAGPKSNYEEIFAYCKYKGIKEINKSNIKYV